jgi:DHA1 family bicyclomycin/chloramphenicol resistance-like MFS transporter
MEVHNRSKKQNVFLILMLGALYTITPFSIDMYLPAFPKIAEDLNESIGKVALSISTYFLVYEQEKLLCKE